MIKFHSSVLFVKDIEKSKDFYVKLLKQEIEYDFGKNVILKNGITLWEISPSHIIDRKLNIKETSNRFELYFESDMLTEIAEHLKNEGVEFLHDIHEEPWGQRTIRFFDSDKHLIEVGEPLETFVQNMNYSGLSLEQIAHKSGISIDTVENILKNKSK